jgi:hypothetical protein
VWFALHPFVSLRQRQQTDATEEKADEKTDGSSWVLGRLADPDQAQTSRPALEDKAVQAGSSPIPSSPSGV